MAESDDLDDLLDSALDDFTGLGLVPAGKAGDEGRAAPSSSSEAVRGLGPGVGLPGPGRGRGKKARQGSAGVRSAAASEALEKLTQQTREAVLGLGTATSAVGGGDGMGLEGDRMVEEFLKQFQELSGSQDMESIVETMMRQLLSKEVLQEPMKEISEKYPAWLEKHKTDLSVEDYDRYSLQFELILKLNEVYEHEPNNFTKIIELMQKMQECGQPPNDIVQELAPDLDLTNLGSALSPDAVDASSNCCIM